MTFDAFVVGYEHKPFAVRRRMGKPVGIIFVGSNLLLVAAVGVHTPDFHQPCSFGIEENIFAIGRIIRTIIETRGIGQSICLTALNRNCINVKFLVAFCTISESFSIGRPSMPI